MTKRPPPVTGARAALCARMTLAAGATRRRAAPAAASISRFIQNILS